MTDQEYTLRRDMLRDAIRKTQSELDGLKEELNTLECQGPPLFKSSVEVSIGDFEILKHGFKVERQSRGISEEAYIQATDLRLRLQKDVIDIWRRQHRMAPLAGRLVSVKPTSNGTIELRFEQ